MLETTPAAYKGCGGRTSLACHGGRRLAHRLELVEGGTGDEPGTQGKEVTVNVSGVLRDVEAQRQAQVQVILGSRHRDVGEAAFLL